MEIWITRLALLWLDGGVWLLAALVSAGPYVLALTGTLLLRDWPCERQRRQPARTPVSPRFTLR